MVPNFPMLNISIWLNDAAINIKKSMQTLNNFNKEMEQAKHTVYYSQTVWNEYQL